MTALSPQNQKGKALFPQAKIVEESEGKALFPQSELVDKDPLQGEIDERLSMLEASQEQQAADIAATGLRRRARETEEAAKRTGLGKVLFGERPRKDDGAGFFKQMLARGKDQLGILGSHGGIVDQIAGPVSKQMPDREFLELGQLVARGEKNKGKVTLGSGMRVFLEEKGKTKKEIEAIRRRIFIRKREEFQNEALDRKVATALKGQPVRLWDESDVPPPESISEKAGATIGGLGAFLLRFAVARKIAGIAGAGPRAASIAGFELENLASGGPLGQGLAFGLGLQIIAKLPVREGFKLLLESAAFGTVTAVQGGDEIDTYISFAIPAGFRGYNRMRKKFSKLIWNAKDLDAKLEVMIKASEAAEAEMKKQGIDTLSKEGIAELDNVLYKLDADLLAAEAVKTAEKKAQTDARKEKGRIIKDRKDAEKAEKQAKLDAEVEEALDALERAEGADPSPIDRLAGKVGKQNAAPDAKRPRPRKPKTEIDQDSFDPRSEADSPPLDLNGKERRSINRKFNALITREVSIMNDPHKQRIIQDFFKEMGDKLSPETMKKIVDEMAQSQPADHLRSGHMITDHNMATMLLISRFMHSLPKGVDTHKINFKDILLGMFGLRQFGDARAENQRLQDMADEFGGLEISQGPLDPFKPLGKITRGTFENKMQQIVGSVKSPEEMIAELEALKKVAEDSFGKRGVDEVNNEIEFVKHHQKLGTFEKRDDINRLKDMIDAIEDDHTLSVEATRAELEFLKKDLQDNIREIGEQLVDNAIQWVGHKGKSELQELTGPEQLRANDIIRQEVKDLGLKDNTDLQQDILQDFLDGTDQFIHPKAREGLNAELDAFSRRSKEGDQQAPEEISAVLSMLNDFVIGSDGKVKNSKIKDMSLRELLLGAMEIEPDAPIAKDAPFGPLDSKPLDRAMSKDREARLGPLDPKLVKAAKSLRPDMDQMPIDKLVDLANKLGVFSTSPESTKARVQDLTELNRKQVITAIDAAIRGHDRVKLDGLVVDLTKKNLKDLSLDDLLVISQQMRHDFTRTAVGLPNRRAARVESDRKSLIDTILRSGIDLDVTELKLTREGMSIVNPLVEAKPKPPTKKLVVPKLKDAIPTAKEQAAAVKVKREAETPKDLEVPELKDALPEPSKIESSQSPASVEPGDIIQVKGKGPAKVLARLKDNKKGVERHEVQLIPSGIKVRVQGPQKLITKRPAGEAPPVARPKKQRDVSLESRRPEVQKLEAPDLVKAQEELQKIDQLQKAKEKLTPEELDVINKLFGAEGEPGRSVEQLAAEMKVSPEDILAIHQRALDKLAGDIKEQQREQDLDDLRRDEGYPGSRPGAVSGLWFKAGKAVITAPFRWIGGLLQMEARDMIHGMMQTGGKVGQQIGFGFRKVVDQIVANLGSFQKENVQGQKTINRHPIASFMMQGVVFGKKRWGVARIAQLVRGEIEPANAGEKAIVNVIRLATISTGKMLEGIGLMTRKGKADNAKLKRFTRTLGGKAFLSLATQEFFDAMVLGRGDPVYDAIVRAYIEANPHMKAAEVQDLFDHHIRQAAIVNNGGAGLKEIGPEIDRWFEVKPTHVLVDMALRKNIKITLMQVEPRAYLDALYQSTGIRAAFVKAFGQDGKIILKLRSAFGLASGNTQWFDATVRTLQGLPPTTKQFNPWVRQLVSPASWTYRSGAFIDALMQVAKQGFLTVTAPIQLTEALGFGATLGYRRLARAITSLSRSREGRQEIIDELERQRAITKDVISISLNRGRLPTDILRKMAAVFSRVHMNKFANELANELPAATQGMIWIADLVKRGREGKTPTRADITRIRNLDYDEPDVFKLASGKGTKAEYDAMAARTTRFAVGLVGSKAQNSPLRNNRVFRSMIAFTSFFSNRARQFDNSFRTMTKHPSPRSIYEFGKLVAGVEAAGIFASFMSAYFKDGVFGVQQKYHEALDDPKEFMINSMLYGMAGPVYGTVFAGVKGAFEEGTDPARAVRGIARVVMPVGYVWDVADAIYSTGPYRNRSGGERLSRFIELHIPVMTSMPKEVLAEFVGMQHDDLKARAALRNYWRWRFDGDNNALPTTGSPGSKNEGERLFRIRMRRAIEDQRNGRDPTDHIFAAFEADPSSISSAILSKKVLYISDMNDDKRKRLKNAIGPDAYRVLEDHDLMMDLLAMQYGPLSKVGTKIKALNNRLENIEREAIGR